MTPSQYLVGDFLYKVEGRIKMNKKSVVGGRGECGVWPSELLRQCIGAKVKVWTNNGSIYDGFVDAFKEGSSEGEKMLALRMKSVIHEKINSSTSEQVEALEIHFHQYGSPVFIKEDGYDCVWASFLSGYFCVYFVHT